MMPSEDADDQALNVFELFAAMVRGPTESIAKDEAPNGVGVSTVVSGDLGPETALLFETPEEGWAHPVERYPDKAAALAGHAKWLEFAARLKPGDKITRLGWGALTDAEEIEYT